jgi:hypothetical protein
MDEEIGRVRIPLQYVSQFLFVSSRVVLGRSFSCVVSLRFFLRGSIEIALFIEMAPL